MNLRSCDPLGMRTAALTFNEIEFHICRIRSGYRSVAALARRTGISPGYCGQVARGLIPPPNTRARLAEALEVSESQIWQTADRPMTAAHAMASTHRIPDHKEQRPMP